jgi:hypothetical protein
MRTLLAAVPFCWISTLGFAAEPKPEIVSLLTLVGEQNLIENPAAALTGPVESMLWEQIRMDRSSSGADQEVVLHSRLTKYDTANRAIEITERQYGGETRATNSYENSLLVGTRGRSFNADGKQAGEEFWQTWKYDDAGRVLETKRGRGDKIENHIVSSYDGSGRLRQREVRQGVADAIVFTELYVYSGKPETVQRRILAAQTGIARDAEKLRLNQDGTVAELWDTADGYHVRWKYDDRNRIIEQLTDPYTPPAGCDPCPLPGAIRTLYEERTRVQTFFEPGGKSVLRRITEFEKDGSIASIRFEAPSGANPADAPDLNRVVSAIVPQGGEQHVVTIWDDHGNWAEKKVILLPGTGAPITHFIYRRKIIYR